MALIVNGAECEIAVDDRQTLADALREKLGLTSVHLGCEHGPCGACTVLVDDEPVRACLMLAVQAEGAKVDTVESLAEGEVLTVVRQTLTETSAFQCGFCTPGFMATIAHLLRVNPTPTRDEVRIALSGNLCRCTGYQPIIDAVLLAADRLNGERQQRTNGVDCA